MSALMNEALAEAVTRRLRPRLPWWYRFRIEIEADSARVSYRTLRPSFTRGWSSWSGTDEADDALEAFLEDLLASIQADIWNTVHRSWPAREGRLGAACDFDDLPGPEVRIRGETIDLWFGEREAAVL